MIDPDDEPFVLPDSILVIAIGCISIEVGISLADFLGYGALRFQVLSIAAFRNDLFGAVQPVYPGHRAVMFLSYSILHGGLVHLSVNMATLLGLGTAVVHAAGERYFVLLYIASALGGAIAYALIGPAGVPMVGASGALFGLAGALAGWDAARARDSGSGMLRVIGFVLLLVVLNIVLWWAAAGQLAWQTHLGGGVAGFVVGALAPPKPSNAA